MLFGNRRKEKNILTKNVKKEDKNLIKEEQVVKELKKEKELTDKDGQKENKKAVKEDIQVKKEQTTNKEQVKNAGAVQGLLFGDRKKEENKLTVKEEKQVNERKIKKEDLTDKNFQKENKKIVEDDIKLKEIEKRNIEHTVVDQKVKEENTEIKAHEKELTEKTDEEIIEPVNDIFKIKKIKSSKRKRTEAVVDIKESQKESKKEESIKKPVEKTKISSNKIIKIKKL